MFRPGDLIVVKRLGFLHAGLERPGLTAICNINVGEVGVYLHEDCPAGVAYFFCLFGEKLGWTWFANVEKA